MATENGYFRLGIEMLEWERGSKLHSLIRVVLRTKEPLTGAFIALLYEVQCYSAREVYFLASFCYLDIQCNLPSFGFSLIGSKN